MARQKGLSTEWSKHLKTEAERKEFSSVVLNDRLVLGRLAEIIDEKLTGLQSRETSLTEYDSPSWAYRQAHMNGIKAGLTAIRNLLP